MRFLDPLSLDTPPPQSAASGKMVLSLDKWMLDVIRLSQFCGEHQDVGLLSLRHIQTPACFSVSFFSLPVLNFADLHVYRPDRIWCDLWNLNADIMTTNIRFGNSLNTLEFNIKQRARLPSIEYLMAT